MHKLAPSSGQNSELQLPNDWSEKKHQPFSRLQKVEFSHLIIAYYIRLLRFF